MSSGKPTSKPATPNKGEDEKKKIKKLQKKEARHEIQDRQHYEKKMSALKRKLFYFTVFFIIVMSAYLYF